MIIVYKNKKHVKLDGVSVSIFTQAKSQEWSRGEAELYKYGNYVSSFPLWGKKNTLLFSLLVELPPRLLACRPVRFFVKKSISTFIRWGGSTEKNRW